MGKRAFLCLLGAALFLVPITCQGESGASRPADLSRSQRAPADKVTATVSVGKGPLAVAVNPVTNKIYVANFDGDTVTVIDGATNSTATVSVGDHPQAVAVNPETDKIYVVNNRSDSVTVIDGGA